MFSFAFSLLGSVSLNTYVVFKAYEMGIVIEWQQYVAGVVVMTLIPYGLRQLVGKRAKWTCEADGCDRQWWHGFMLHFHHVKPRSEGGEDSAENLELLCVDHHRDRHRDLAALHKRRGNTKAHNDNARAARTLDGQDRMQKNHEKKWRHRR